MTASRDTEPPTGPEHRQAGAPLGPMAAPADLLPGIGGSWLWILGSAISALVPGILILVWPDETLHVLAVLIGLYLLVAGGFRFAATFSRDARGDRFPRLLVSVLFVLAGVLCLRHPMQTIAALSLIVGVVWILSGMATAYTALTTKDMPHRGFVIGASFLAIVAGIVVLALPSESARALTRLLGLWLVLLGVAETILALAWRGALRSAGLEGAGDSGARDAGARDAGARDPSVPE
ncbi:HdeD family acid-resistance protein [Streptomyces sp. NPDC046805]|uniref:HdeD family acid-resistance protein n=1 Tax=Streptomyces sp. NPDC046805 TaxID=3155134 RepID=UPI00340ACE21